MDTMTENTTGKLLAWIVAVGASVLFFTAPAEAQSTQEILHPKKGKVFYVRRNKASNKNPGTPSAPLKNIDKALAMAGNGDTIAVAAGRYKGRFGVGYWHFDKGVRLYGGFNADFSTRDPSKHHTLLQPGADRFAKSGTRWMMRNSENTRVVGVVIDGFIFDQGFMNPYMAEGRPEGCETGMMKVSSGSRNPDSPGLVLSGNDFVVRNNVFVNCANTAIRIFLTGTGTEQLKDKAKCEIVNNIIIACRNEGIVVASGDREAATRAVRIHHNTVLFTWTRLSDLADSGYAIDIRKKIPHLIEDNIVALSLGPGLNHQHFNPKVEINRNVFFGNRVKDLWISPASNTLLRINADEFEDLDLDNEGNANDPRKLPLDPAYLQAVLSLAYPTKSDFESGSEANKLRASLGVPARTKHQERFRMFANRYPWKTAVRLFGAAKNVGAQKP